jgi:hypothetical protein
LVVYQTGLENDYSYNDEVNNSEPGYCTLEGGVFLTQVVLPWTIQRYLTSTSSSSEQTTGKKLAILSPAFPLNLETWPPLLPGATPLKKFKHSVAVLSLPFQISSSSK